MVTEIKTLPADCKAFEANGKRYIVHTDLTLDGYIVLEDIRLTMEIGSTPMDMLAAMRKAYNSQNAGKFADAARLMYDAINLGERLETGTPPAWLEALTLFVRPEGADVAAWNRTDALLWIEDWEREGISVTSLFTIANACSTVFATNFLPLFLQSSDSGTGENGESEAEKNSALAN